MAATVQEESICIRGHSSGGTPAFAGAARAITVIGRTLASENGRICSEYFLTNTEYGGKPVYREMFNNFGIYYNPGSKIWILGRNEGSCIAWAEDAPCVHDFKWHIYDSTHQAHIYDPQLISVAAPKNIALFGRDPKLSNCVIMGCYQLHGVRNAKPCYIHRKEGFVMMFSSERNAWIVGANDNPEHCFAYATFISAGVEAFPNFSQLEWNIFEPGHGFWKKPAMKKDLQVKSFAAPEHVHVAGAGHAGILQLTGSYQLVGHSAGRPVYYNKSNGCVVRYEDDKDLWLICPAEGCLVKKGLVERVATWLFTGNFEAFRWNSGAYAHAKKASDPTLVTESWNVWNPKARCFESNPTFLTTTAPRSVSLQYLRDGGLQKNIISGVYELYGSFDGRLAYVKLGSTYTCGLFWAKDKWVISPSLPSAKTDRLIAYAEASSNTTCPTGTRIWHIFDGSRGQWLEDTCGLHVTGVAGGSGSTCMPQEGQRCRCGVALPPGASCCQMCSAKKLQENAISGYGPSCPSRRRQHPYSHHRRLGA